MISISKINKTKGKIKVILSNEETLDIYPSVATEFNLYKNKELDEKVLKEIREANKTEKYFIDITKRLSINDYSPQKIEEILYKKGANKSEIKEIIEKLHTFSFLDEQKMVEEVISFCDSKHYGYNRIIKMLYDKKISKKEIEKVKYNLNREEKEGKIQTEILIRKNVKKNNASLKKSVFSGLIRLGFDEGLSIELVNKISNSNHIHELNVLKLDYEKYFMRYSSKYKGLELNQKVTNALLSKGYQINDINYVKEHIKWN